MKNISKYLCSVLLLMGLLFTPAIVAQAQSYEIKGVVVDKDNNALTGVVVFDLEKQTAVITDQNGQFSFKSGVTKVLAEFSCLGYEIQKVELLSVKNNNVTMLESAYELDAVVSVGYGTMKKSDLAGSVTSIKMDDESETKAYSSVDQILQGRMSGVNITSNSGAPGSSMNIQIRGTSTIEGNTQPLYVIDGMPMDVDNELDGVDADGNDLGEVAMDNPLMMINPSEIESIEILKDASATAIYGSRATNGVVLITTKQGEAGKMTIAYNTRVDVSQIANKIDMLNGYDYGLYKNEQAISANGYDMYGNIIDPDYSKVKYNAADLEQLKTIYTDWQDLMYETAISTDHSLQLKGGNAKTGTMYSVVMGYSDNEGILRGSGSDRYSFRSNLSTKLTDRLNMKLNLNYTEVEVKSLSHSAGTNTKTIVGKTIWLDPTELPGDITYDEEEYDDLDYVSTDNPFTMTELYKDISRSRSTIVQAQLEYDITSKWKAQVKGSMNNGQSERRAYTPQESSTARDEGGIASYKDQNKQNFVFDATTNYANQFGKHSINAVAGYSYEDRTRDLLSLTAIGFPSDDMQFYALESSTDVTKKNSSYEVTRLASFIARANYVYDDKYIFTFTGRYDGSSLLAAGNQWAFFPSAAFAWRINEEKWLKSASWLSNLKLRTSYGHTGSQNTQYGAAYALMEVDRTTYDTTLGHGITNGKLANPDLTWARTYSTNVGIDAGFYKNRFRVVFDYYNRLTTGTIMSLGTPYSSGYGSYKTNLGVISNYGYEFEVGANIITTKDWQWSVDANLSINRNEVVDYEGNVRYGTSYMTAGSTFGQAVNVTKEGYPIGSFYGYVTDGVYQNAEECAAAPYGSNATPGSLRYVDISGPNGVPDGKITADDKTVIGSPQADFTYGINTNLSWKKLSFSMSFTGRKGADIANLTRYITDSYNGDDTNISQAAWDGRWQGEGTSNYYPAVNGADKSHFNKRFSTFMLEDGSFLKLKNVSLSWRHNFKKGFCQSIRISLSGTNLYTLTDYTGYDPEVSASGQASARNVDFAVYPSSRTYSVGANITF